MADEDEAGATPGFFQEIFAWQYPPNAEQNWEQGNVIKGLTRE